jgi:hypothetical protein
MYKEVLDLHNMVSKLYQKAGQLPLNIFHACSRSMALSSPIRLAVVTAKAQEPGIYIIVLWSFGVTYQTSITTQDSSSSFGSPSNSKCQRITSSYYMPMVKLKLIRR